MRDARVGMLPPKLAQIIVNLASSGNNRFGATVLDPFCGTGVILQESLLMGFKAYGTDIEQRMIDFSNNNLTWFKDNFLSEKEDVTPLLEKGDATSHKWLNSFDFVAGETYLGRPLSSIPDDQTLSKIINDCDTIHKKFLFNLASQTPSGMRLCLAVPAWITKRGILHLKTLDYLQDLGYTRQSFVHANNKQLVYYREGQNVGRELVVLIRK
jgi:tRNA G10  N-methylase Trm11